MEKDKAQSEEVSSNDPSKGQQMSFKDWKMNKEIVDPKKETKKKSDKSNRKNDKINSNKSTPPSLFNLNFDQNSFCGYGGGGFGNGPLNFSGPNNNRNGGGGNWNFSGQSFGANFRENCGMNFNGGGMSFNGNSGYFSGPNFNGQNNGINFNGQNNGINFNGQNGGMNFNARNGGMNQKGSTNFNGQNSNYRGSGGGSYRNGNGYNSQNCSDDFFQRDDLYIQKDMIEETLADNPFRNRSRARQLLNELKYSKTQHEKKKAPARKDPAKSTSTGTYSGSTKTEPKIFIKNPRQDSNVKPYIPMPKPPESEISGTLEERKQQWKDYRESMKPFKNREFYNAKRVVQRLGKKDPSELDEKEQFRLSNAHEKMAEYKQKLSEKYDHYIQTPNDESPNGSGELFVLKKGTQSQWSSSNKANPAQYQNYGNFGESLSSSTDDYDYPSGSGRKILGGTSKYSTFVSGGTLERTLGSQY